MSETRASITFQVYDNRGNYQGDRHTEVFDADTTRNILDTICEDHILRYIEDGTNNEEGDDFFYSAEAMALVDNHYGDSFTVWVHYDEDGFRDYLADRRERGIPEDGVKIDMRAFHLRAKIQKINDLIATLPEDGSVLWLSTDGSWGGATDLSLYDRDTLPEDVLDAYEIEDDNI